MTSSGCNNIKLTTDRSNFYPILDKHMIQLQDGVHRLINRNDYYYYKHNTIEGIKHISNLQYTFNESLCTANVTNFSTGRNPNTLTRVWKDLSKNNHPFSNNRSGSMKMLF